MKSRNGRGWSLFLAVSVFLGLCGVALGINPNERVVEPERNIEDPEDINAEDGNLWVLDFRFKDPRLITVDVPGRGKQTCMYLWYQVINNTGKPRYFIPDFELKTNDLNTIYKDEILPSVENAIRKIEDPTGYLNMKNSVKIATEPIPPSRPEASPKKVTGVAIFMDPNERYPRDTAEKLSEKENIPKLADSNSFTIFIAGLSNGWAVTDPIPPATKPDVRRKTLQLNFRRPGDRFDRKSEEIKFLPSAKWIYRGSTLEVPGLPTELKPNPDN